MSPVFKMIYCFEIRYLHKMGVSCEYIFLLKILKEK